MLDDLVEVINTLKARMADYRESLQDNETRTRTALIDPLLRALGWDVSDPALVTPEYNVGSRRPDYALLNDNAGPCALLEAKKLGEPLGNHLEQMVRDANMAGVPYAGLTDGNRWELYTVFEAKPLAERRILNVAIGDTPAHECALQLLMLWRPNLSSGRPIEASPPLLSVEPEAVTTLQPSASVRSSALDVGWVSLSDFQGESGGRPPAIMRFSNDAERQVATWKALLVQVAEWLVSSGWLEKSSCPILSGKKRFLVSTSPVHPTGKPFEAASQLSNGLFIQTAWSAPQLINKCRDLMTNLGQDAASVHLRLN